MANLKAAIKRVKTAVRNRERNVTATTQMKSATRTALKTLGTAQPNLPTEGLPQEVRNAISWIDHIATKGVIHKRQAARRKSRLMKRWQKNLATSTPSISQPQAA